MYRYDFALMTDHHGNQVRIEVTGESKADAVAFLQRELPKLTSFFIVNNLVLKEERAIE